MEASTEEESVPETVEISLTPEQRAFVEEMATNNGISPQKYIEGLFDKGYNAERKEAVAPNT
jgi:hypothetical protein